MLGGCTISSIVYLTSESSFETLTVILAPRMWICAPSPSFTTNPMLCKCLHFQISSVLIRISLIGIARPKYNYRNSTRTYEFTALNVAGGCCYRRCYYCCLYCHYHILSSCYTFEPTTSGLYCLCKIAALSRESF